MARPKTSPPAETVGERIKRLRLARGLSQRQLAGPGVSYAYISRIEANTRRPSVKALRTIAPALGVSPWYLEYGEEDPVEKLNRLLSALFDVRRLQRQHIKSLQREVRELRRQLQPLRALDVDLLEAVRMITADERAKRERIAEASRR